MSQPGKICTLAVGMQAEVGKIMGLFAGRVFQIEKEALAKLREVLAGAKRRKRRRCP